MALTISNVASQTNTASNANTTTAGTFSVSAGDMCIAFVALDNTGFGGAASLSSVTDNASNTYSQIALINQNPGAAAAGATLGIYGVTYSSAASGLTVSANFSPNTVADVIAVYRLTPGSGEAVSLIAADTTGSKNSTTTHSAATVSVQNGDTIFGAAAIESNTAVTEDSDTTNGSWSAAFTGVANTGTDLTSMRLVVQHKTVTATGNQSWAATTSAAKDSACTYAVFRGVATGINIAADAGSYSLSGTAAGTLKGFIVPADAGSYTLSGTNADITVTVSAVLTAETGAYELSGTAAGTLKGFMVSAEAGSYSLTGTDATLTIDGGLTHYTLTADAGSYVLTGTTAGTLHGWQVAAEAGSYSLDGAETSSFHGRVTSVETVPYEIIGSVVATVKGRYVHSDAGSYELLGASATFKRDYAVSSAQGSYLLSGVTSSIRHRDIIPVGKYGFDWKNWHNYDQLIVRFPTKFGRRFPEDFERDGVILRRRKALVGSADTVVDWDSHNFFSISVGANTTLSIVNPRPDSDFVVLFTKDNTGNVYSITWVDTIDWRDTTPIVSLSSPNETQLVQISYYDGVYRV